MEFRLSLSKVLRAIFLLAMVLGCSNDDDGTIAPESFFFRFKLDGELIEFTETTVFSSSSQALGTYHYSLNGGNGVSAFTINILNNSAIANGQNLGNTVLEETGTPQSYLSFASTGSDIYNYSSWLPYSDGTEYILPCSVTIETVSSTNISGTFNGIMGMRDDPDQTFEVTEGRFTVKR